MPRKPGFSWSGVRGGFPAKQDSDGVVRVFDPGTGAFGATIGMERRRPTFKPGRRGYFEDQPGQPVDLKTFMVPSTPMKTSDVPRHICPVCGYPICMGSSIRSGVGPSRFVPAVGISSASTTGSQGDPEMHRNQWIPGR